MRYLSQIRRLERLFPPTRPEVIVHWGDSKGRPSEIFSTNGWKISFDGNGAFERTGNVPGEYTEDLLQPPDPPQE